MVRAIDAAGNKTDQSISVTVKLAIGPERSARRMSTPGNVGSAYDFA